MPMLTTTTVDQVRQAVKQARTDGLRIGLVPTMGHLHEGHLSLIRAARLDCPYIVVSIFVNPTQFVAGDDYQTYPRTPETDLDACHTENVDLVFAPNAEQMYHHQPLTTVQVAKLTETLCGAHRPGHFDGVTTVVAKLFNIVQPDAAYFGQKDAQQVVEIKKMAADLFFPVQIVVCPTVRGPDGLALSSRNDYLSDREREQAASLNAALQAAADQIAQGQRATDKLIALMRNRIPSVGCWIDYVAIVHPETLEPVEQITGPVLLAIAVRIGQARLIDNILAAPSLVRPV